MKCCDIVPGMLRHSVELQSLTNTPDGFGGYTTTWTTYATVRARLENISGSERIFNERLNAETTIRATIRYRSDIKESDRILIGSSSGGGGEVGDGGGDAPIGSGSGVPHQIRYIDNLEFRNRWMRLTLESGVAT